MAQRHSEFGGVNDLEKPVFLLTMVQKQADYSSFLTNEVGAVETR